MPELLALLAAFSTLITSGLAEQMVKREVRYASGKLLYESTTRGHQTKVRDPFGKTFDKDKDIIRRQDGGSLSERKTFVQVQMSAFCLS